MQEYHFKVFKLNESTTIDIFVFFKFGNSSGGLFCRSAKLFRVNFAIRVSFSNIRAGYITLTLIGDDLITFIHC